MSGRSEKNLAALGISLTRERPNSSQGSANPNSRRTGNDEEGSELNQTDKKLHAVLEISLNERPNFSQESPNPNSHKTGNDEEGCSELKQTDEKMHAVREMSLNEGPNFSQESPNPNIQKKTGNDEEGCSELRQTDAEMDDVFEISLDREKQNTNQESCNKNSPKIGNDKAGCSGLMPTEEGDKYRNNENFENEDSDDSSSSSDHSSSDSFCSKGSSCSRSSSTSSSNSPVDDSDRDPDFNIENYESDESTISIEGNVKTRKRKRNPAGWKRNISKKLRNCGKEYRSLHNGQLIPARKILPPCKNTCKLTCTAKFTQNLDREQLFNYFWSFGDLERQRNFILSNMHSIQPKYRRVLIDRQKERGLNKAYYFIKNDEHKQVCFFFFRGTLGVSERFIRTVKCKDEGGFLAKDLRGKDKQLVISEQIKIDMRNHLSSIPAVESHYTRANTEKIYRGWKDNQ